MSVIFRVHQPHPRGPRSEGDAVLAAGEVDERGFLTGGPVTPEEWEQWNAKLEQGQIGRFVMKGDEP